MDMSNINDGDKSIGVYVNGEFLQFRDFRDVELFYSSISLKELLKTYTQYVGLNCYKTDHPKEYRNSYNLDILSILELL